MLPIWTFMIFFILEDGTRYWQFSEENYINEITCEMHRVITDAHYDKVRDDLEYEVLVGNCFELNPIPTSEVENIE